MSRIIINGDDFGMNEACSRAIAQAFRIGAITDTTAMANGAFFDEAIRLAFEQGFEDRIGIHFNLTEGVPLTDAIRHIPDFVRDGRFVKSYVNLPRELNGAERQAVYAELTAQGQRLQRAGITITHADSHHYIHNIEYLSGIVTQVCRDLGIGRIRLKRNVGVAAGASEDRRYWRAHGFVTADFFCRLSDAFYGTASDTVEIMVHPDYDRDGRLIDRTGMKDGTPVGKALLPPDPSRGITMMSYRDLIRS